MGERLEWLSGEILIEIREQPGPRCDEPARMKPELINQPTPFRVPPEQRLATELGLVFHARGSLHRLDLFTLEQPPVPAHQEGLGGVSIDFLHDDVSSGLGNSG